jgi:hypothetical protein
VVHHHIFLQNRCDQLEASNKKQIKKRAIKHKFTSQRGIFGSRENSQDDVVIEDDGDRFYSGLLRESPLASGPRYSVQDIAHKYRGVIPSLETNIAVSRESRALSTTVSSRPPPNPSCMYHICSRIASFSS